MTGFQSTGKAVQDVIEDPARAEMISNTEYARAMTEANLATYAENEVEELDWLAESDACEECKENEEASPIKAGDEWPNGDVPCHPRCRCAISAHITLEPTPLEETQ